MTAQISDWLNREGINIPIHKQDKGKMIKVFKVPVIKKPGRRLRNTCGSTAFDLKKQPYNALMNSAPPHGPSDDKVQKHLGVVFMVRLEVKYHLQGQCP